MKRASLACALLCLALPLFAAEEVPCLSLGDGYRECRVASSGKIMLVREMSDNLCMEGVTWGTLFEGTVWVKRGCQALFKTMPPDHAPGRKAMARTITCESQDGARKHCEADTAFGVAMTRQLSDELCSIGKTWDFDDKGIWVAEGCRAQFVLGGFRIEPHLVPPTAKQVHCESPDGERHLCAIDAARGVGLLQETSRERCVLNRTWGYDHKGIWVTAGCGADFVVAAAK